MAPGELECGDGACIAAGLQCDGNDDCADASDRCKHAMAYVDNNEVMMYGSITATAVPIAGMWQYDVVANSWSALSPTTEPAARYSHTMTHIGGAAVIGSAGTDAIGGATIMSDTWEYVY